MRVKCAILPWNVLREGLDTYEAGHGPVDRGAEPRVTGPRPAAEEPEAMTTSDDVMRALKAVFDPEIGINIVDLGLVYGATVEGSTVTIDMTLTSPGLSLAGVIEAQANAILTSNFEDVDAVKMNWVWVPPWDPRTMASEDARLELGIW